MTSQETTVEGYLKAIPEDRKEAFNKLRNTIIDNLPEGFEEIMSYGMIAYVVPHSLYPNGYHVNPKQPLPFTSIANQKNSINLYSGGIYSKPEILDWFVSEYPKYVKRKLDMGKSCIRFKKPDEIPFELIAELSQKINPQEWIDLYEFKRQK